MNPRPFIEYTCHGVSWSTGRPTLLLTDVNIRRLEHVDLAGQTLGFAVTSNERWCIGRYRVVDTYSFEPLPCPLQAAAFTDDRCLACTAHEEFRLVPDQDGPVPASWQTYLDQRHWLYLATFADGASTVGTAAGLRKTMQINEMGPLQATYLAELPDGRTARQVEDALSAHLGTMHVARRTVNPAALVNPNVAAIAAAHDLLLQRALDCLIKLGHIPETQPWSLPDAGRLVRQPNRQHARALYPDDLRTGRHDIHIESCLGTTALARLTAQPDTGAVRYLADLSTLTGARIAVDTLNSPPTEPPSRPRRGLLVGPPQQPTSLGGEVDVDEVVAGEVRRDGEA
jgi:hypothetical protein